MKDIFGVKASHGLANKFIPAAPVISGSNPNSQTSNNLSWTAPFSPLPIIDYKLERAPFNSNTWTVLTSNSSAKTYTDTGLSGNTIYKYRVAARNSFGYGPYSSVIERQTLCIFTSSGTWVRPSGCTNVELLVVGAGSSGGGAGWVRADPEEWGHDEIGVYADPGGAGGAVRYFLNHTLSSASSSYSVAVATTNNSSYSQFDNIISYSGYSFYNTTNYASGQGAGAGYEIAGLGTVTFKVSRSPYNSTYGNIGADTSGGGFTGTSYPNLTYYGYGGGSGGAGGAGSGKDGGPGITISITGTPIEYGKGGSAGNIFYNEATDVGSYDPPSVSGVPQANTGSGGGASQSLAYSSPNFGYANGNNGAAGIVVIRAL